MLKLALSSDGSVQLRLSIKAQSSVEQAICAVFLSWPFRSAYSTCVTSLCMKEWVHDRTHKTKEARFARQERSAWREAFIVQAQFHVKGGSKPAEWMDITKVQWMQSDRPPQQRMLICQLVRQSIEIWWPQDEKYYRGTVTEYLPEPVRSGPPVNHAFIHLVCAHSHPVHVSFAQRVPPRYIHGNKGFRYGAQQCSNCCVMSDVTWGPRSDCLSQPPAARQQCHCCKSSSTCTGKVS